MRILFATDGSESAEVALDMLLALPLRPSDHVTVLAVPVHRYVGVGFDGTGAFVAEVAEEEIATARRTAGEARDRLLVHGTRAVARIKDGPIAQTIIEAAREDGTGLIVLGTRGHGRVAGALLGSTARAVARHSPVPVLVVRERRDAPKRILVAADGSRDAEAAIRTLVALPLPNDAEVTLLHVFPDRRIPEDGAGPIADELKSALEREDRQTALELLSHARAILPTGLPVRMELERGKPIERILESARSAGVDLIVAGSRGRSLQRGFLQGSTADRLLTDAHCAVLVARAPDHARPRPPEREAVAVG